MNRQPQKETYITHISQQWPTYIQYTYIYIYIHFEEHETWNVWNAFRIFFFVKIIPSHFLSLSFSFVNLCVRSFSFVYSVQCTVCVDLILLYGYWIYHVICAMSAFATLQNIFQIRNRSFFSSLSLDLYIRCFLWWFIPFIMTRVISFSFNQTQLFFLLFFFFNLNRIKFLKNGRKLHTYVKLKNLN